MTTMLSTKAISQLFERMTYIYAHKWTSAMGESTAENGELSVAAKTWQAGLSGITTQQISKGLERAALSGNPWSPSLPEFRLLCLYRDDVPSITAIAQILLKSMRTGGTVAERYQHPIILSIAKNRRFDAFQFRTSTMKQCEDIINPIYEELLQNGWDEFKPEHFENQKAIEREIVKPIPDKFKSHFAELRNALNGGV